MRITRGTLLAAGAVVLGVPALAAMVALADGDDFRDVVAQVAVVLVLSATGAAAALLVGRRFLPAPTPDSRAGTEARVGRALRAGRTDDAVVDGLARKEAGRRVDQRWQRWLYGACGLGQALLVIGADRASSRLVAGMGVLLWSALLWRTQRQLREARRYLAEPADTP